MIERNPALKDKLNYPIIEHSRLKVLMNHSLNCQHLLCKSPEANPAVSTLFVDHTCGDEVVLSLNDGDCRGLGYLINACKTDERNNSVVPEISEQAQLYTLRLPDPILTSKIDRIAYNNSGYTIFALSCSGALKFWNMKTENANEAREVSYSGFLSNDVGTGEHELVVPCFALSKNDSYVASASGGKVSLFGLQTSEIELFKNLTTVMSPPPAATCAMFYPEDNNFIIFGMEDGSIRIYDVRTDQVKAQIKAHDQTRVTGLAYSSALNILVSSAYNAEISSWSNFALIKQTSKFLDIGGHVFPGRTCVKFQQDQKLILVVHENCLATLEGPDLKLCSQWVSNELISDATYSCDGLTIYASFIRGHIVIFDSSFTERCIINPSAYIPQNPSTMVNCWAIAAHPNNPNQFAIGLGDGSVLVVEPREGNWPGTPQLDNVAAGEKDHEMPVEKKLI
ncbi:topless-related protein 4-like [Apium graveolens]|uniref:topless-related protein 4-like n=1 Tax=Apium graveolens TaxID=4045 RepID=UPI003D7978DD